MNVWRRLAATLAAAAVLAVSGPADAQVAPVDTALVLAVDASGSIDDVEFRLQKDGIAEAITDRDVLAAVTSDFLGRIAIAYVEWGGPRMAATVVGWHVVEDAAGAAAFAEAVRAAPRSPQSYNAIGDAIDHAVGLLAACPCEPTRRVIDVSGDNPDNRSMRPVAAARDAAVAERITINALAITSGIALGPSGRPHLVENYEREVIGGPGAFVIAAASRRDFATAMRQKLLLEIAGLMPARTPG